MINSELRNEIIELEEQLRKKREAFKMMQRKTENQDAKHNQDYVGKTYESKDKFIDGRPLYWYYVVTPFVEGQDFHRSAQTNQIICFLVPMDILDMDLLGLTEVPINEIDFSKPIDYTPNFPEHILKWIEENKTKLPYPEVES